jgi:hypothetical protein
MSLESLSTDQQARARTWASWCLSREFWGGVTLLAIWLAVLFVGVFGGNINTASAGGDSSSVPVVVVIAIAALLATVSVGRWAFRPSRFDEDLREVLGEERRAVEELTAQIDELRTKFPPTNA